MKCIKYILLTLPLFSHLAADDFSELPENGWSMRSGNQQTNRHGPSKEQMRQKPKDLFLLDIGAVYLKPYQGGTDFAQTITSSETNGGTQQPYGTNKPMDFEYDWGVRAALGYQGGKSRQSLKATYLYLASDAHKSVSADLVNNGVQTLLVQSVQGDGIGNVFRSASSHWNLHFNMLDLSFGKKYPKMGCMTFEPFIGLKGIILSESQKYSYNQDKGVPPGSSKIKQTVHFEGAGVMGGLNLDWRFINWLSLSGSIDAALLYSSIKTKRTSDNGLPTIMWIGSSHDIRGTPVLEGSLALRGVYCWKNSRFIDLKIGYEGHYIFDTMKHAFFNADSSTDLSLMGWFATLGFGF